MLQLYIQQTLFPELDESRNSVQKRDSRPGTFTDNMKLPMHRWFRYSAGFSAEWVEQEISACKNKDTSINVSDPFAGSATALLAAESVRAKAVGFVNRIRLFTGWLRQNSDGIQTTKMLREIYREIIKKADEGITETERLNIPLLRKCFTSDSLSKLDSLKNVFLSEFDNGGILHFARKVVYTLRGVLNLQFSITYCKHC